MTPFLKSDAVPKEGLSLFRKSHWERGAANWIAWARSPGHDVYWSYRDAFFELIPPPGRATLEIGCGEGHVRSDLASRGHGVTGIDESLSLLRAAARRS